MSNLLKKIWVKTGWVKVEPVATPEPPKEKTLTEKLAEIASQPKNYHEQVVEILRGKNYGITKKVGDSFYASLSEVEKKKKVFELNNAFENKVLFELLDYLIGVQMQTTAMEAPDMDIVSFGRATINGIELIREHLEQAHGEYEEMRRGGEKFDKFELIPKP